jgi:L-ascorbate metabolism protein UlaG (beta-lactamase superfamily)
MDLSVATGTSMHSIPLALSLP